MEIKKITAYDWLKKLDNIIQTTLCKKEGSLTNFNSCLGEAGLLILEKVTSGASIWWAGNGGSAAICSHLSQDMLNKLGAKSFFLGDTSLITCMGNDFGYEAVYCRPLENFMQQGDLLIAISSSGNSENILACADLADKKNVSLITLSGMNEGNRLWNRKSDISFFVDATLYGLVEVAHEAILHSIIETLWLAQKDG
ncbi:SIS domain-containing protein [Desulfobacter latus]|uniref:SIS domain-containing protein n=1 Tax=Desulfobacter latus TaxID=2292 RepID=A0A850T1I1_9BACT|nr:SIS domain-containing protein [Desulfobacter latus]NWH04951.1 SIS domain-containing protein [Desulfobacter latus]